LATTYFQVKFIQILMEKMGNSEDRVRDSIDMLEVFQTMCAHSVKQRLYKDEIHHAVCCLVMSKYGRELQERYNKLRIRRIKRENKRNNFGASKT
jgi:hypothetical protein